MGLLSIVGTLTNLAADDNSLSSLLQRQDLTDNGFKRERITIEALEATNNDKTYSENEPHSPCRGAFLPSNTLPASAPIAAEIASQLITQNGDSGRKWELLQRVRLQEELGSLHRRLSEAEKEAARHVHVISSMHAWAGKTVSTLRQLQLKCASAEERASVAEQTAETLKSQFSQLSARHSALEATLSTILDDSKKKSKLKRKLRSASLRPTSTGDSLIEKSTPGRNLQESDSVK